MNTPLFNQENPIGFSNLCRMEGQVLQRTLQSAGEDGARQGIWSVTALTAAY
jgi:hypothetical protein